MRWPARRWRVLRPLVLGVVLAVLGLVVPDASVAPTRLELVEVRRSQGVDLSPEVTWILALGSDARPGQEMTRTRADAIQLVGINTRTGAAAAIGVPRDAWVPVPGHGRTRVNAGLVHGGPQLMARTVQGLTGVEPDYVMVTRFPFFEQMVDDIGGITVHNPRRFADPDLKREGFARGRIRLGGYDAMAFSRIRKGLPDGDFGRSANQQRTLRGIHARIVQAKDRPGFLERGVMTVLRHTRTDASPAELFRIAQAVAAVRPRAVTTCVVPGRLGFAGSASVVFPDVATARRWGADARRDATLRC
ncbi:LCP family protein [Nocardioides solisilvae]|uniref:LCP family protein n=1 Tax=Nocardioides solisilvae TaxID=1542435 RepID=UPI000D745467|nr:LCP family protein [Nocardioides solisilvae]